MGRNFTVSSSSVNINGGKYSGATPMKAAQKAAQDLFTKYASKRIQKISFCIRDMFSDKTYNYIATRKRQDANKEYKIIVEKNDKKKKVTKSAKRSKRLGGTMRNFVLITDIGRDIDDTLALIVLLHKHKQNEINLKAIVVGGYVLDEREKLVYYWLHKFGIDELSDDRKIPVFITPGIWNTDNTNDLICNYPDDMLEEEDLKTFMKSYKENTLPKLLNSSNVKRKFTDDANEMYKNFIETNDNLEILCIANITWVNHLYQNDILTNDNVTQKIKKIYIQGGYYVEQNEENGVRNETLEPIDYNMNLDKTAAKSLINAFKTKIPFIFLGKYTAYLIKFHNVEFNAFDKQFNINLKSQAVESMFGLYVTKRPIFNSVFERDIKNPEMLSSLSKTNQDELNNILNTRPFDYDHKLIVQFVNALYKISNPYDLILVYLALNEGEFKFDYTHNGKNEYPSVYPNKPLLPFKKIYDSIKHYQFNIQDAKVFTSENEKKVQEDLKNFVLNSAVSMQRRNVFANSNARNSSPNERQKKKPRTSVSSEHII